MANFGIPYMGSKDKIARSIAMNFPKAENFYDLFGGGFSMTHYMLLNRSHYYKNFHFNEIESCTVELIKDAVAGKYSDKNFKPPWVSREDFFKNIKDPYIRVCWSFGNNQKDYMFSPEIEPYKKSMHMAVVFDEFDKLAAQVLRFKSWPEKVNTIYKRRIYLRQIIEHYRKTKIPDILHQFLNSKQLQQLESLQRLQQLERLQQLQQLERLQSLQQLERLLRLERLQGLTNIKNSNIEFTSKDYREVAIKPNSIVYCDIPYLDTAEYIRKFDHRAFYDWAATRDFPVYISEYTLPDDRFQLIYTINKNSLLNPLDKKKSMQEKLFWNGKKPC